MANETWKFVQAKSKQVMKSVLGIRDEQTRMKATSPLVVAPITQEDDTTTCDGTRKKNCCNCFQPLRALRARSPRQACPARIK